MYIFVLLLLIKYIIFSIFGDHVVQLRNVAVEVILRILTSLQHIELTKLSWWLYAFVIADVQRHIFRLKILYAATCLVSNYCINEPSIWIEVAEIIIAYRLEILIRANRDLILWFQITLYCNLLSVVNCKYIDVVNKC